MFHVNNKTSISWTEHAYLLTYTRCSIEDNANVVTAGFCLMSSDPKSCGNQDFIGAEEDAHRQ